MSPPVNLHWHWDSAGRNPAGMICLFGRPPPQRQWPPSCHARQAAVVFPPGMPHQVQTCAHPWPPQSELAPLLKGHQWPRLQTAKITQYGIMHNDKLRGGGCCTGMLTLFILNSWIQSCTSQWHITNTVTTKSYIYEKWLKWKFVTPPPKICAIWEYPVGSSKKYDNHAFLYY